MEINFLGTTSQGGHCPTVFESDRGTLLFQGDKVTDLSALTTVNETYAGLGENETVVEVPIALLAKIPVAMLQDALRQAEAVSTS